LFCSQKDLKQGVVSTSDLGGWIWWSKCM